jgi:hypothetical protein
MVPGLRVRHKDNETLHAGYTFSASADLFDVNIILFAFLDWFGSKPITAAKAACAASSSFVTHLHFPPPIFIRSIFSCGCYGRNQQSSRNGRRTFSGTSTLRQANTLL